VALDGAGNHQPVTDTSSAAPDVPRAGRSFSIGRAGAAARPATPKATLILRWVPSTVIGLAGLALLWSRLIEVNQGLWGDEAISVVRYIDPGPSAIWDASRWLPNDHMLFELLTWATTGILGSHVASTYRLWSVLPAMAAGALMTWWLWRRLDRWTAAIFAVLATAAPLYLNLSWQARGYGLCFLAAVVVVIGADLVVTSGSRSGMLLFCVGGFVGMATLQNFVGMFVAAALMIALIPTRRRAAIIALVATGVATLIWYSPLLSLIIGYQNQFGRPLAWDGFVVAPFRDLFGAGVNQLYPSISVFAGAIVAALAVALGLIELWRRSERPLAALLLVPSLATYLLIEIAAKYTPRFASFAILPLIALAAVGLAGLGLRIARVRGLAPVMVVVFVALALLVLGRFVRYAGAFAQVPYEAGNTAAEIVDGFDPPNGRIPILSNDAFGTFGIYSAPRRSLTAPASVLLQAFCTYRGRLVYLEQEKAPPYPSTACLSRRGAWRIEIPQRRARLWVWLVPPMNRGSAVRSQP
jgi:hypothetical protein